MSALTRDPAATASTLERWLTKVAELDEVQVTDVSIPGSTGWSNETILFDAAWRTGAEVKTRELVARIAPTNHTVFPDQTFSTQYAVMQALADHGAVPMATIHWLEPSTEWFGSQFWIMDRIRGDIPADAPPYAGAGWLHDASPADQARAWWSGIDAMVTVHQLDVDVLAPDITTVPLGADPLTAQLDHYERFLTWAEDGRTHPFAREVLSWLRDSTRSRPRRRVPR